MAISGIGNGFNWGSISSLNTSSMLDSLSSWSSLSSSATLGTDSLDDLTSMLTDSYMIRDGSYQKLAESYYDKVTAVDNSEETAALTDVRASAEALADSAEALTSRAMYDDASASGDRSAITSAVEGFVSDYNSMLDSLDQVDSTSVLQKGVFMSGTTASHKDLLAKAGLSIGDGSKLTLDKETLASADMSTLKSLFTGANSYASKIETKAGQIFAAAGSGASAMYGSKGGYVDLLNSTGSFFDSEI